VLSFVVEVGDEFEVFESVVELVSVPVVDLESGGDRAVLCLPDDDVLHSESLLDGIPDSSVAL
jgi:hypothetical protein